MNKLMISIPDDLDAKIKKAFEAEQGKRNEVISEPQFVVELIRKALDSMVIKEHQK